MFKRKKKEKGAKMEGEKTGKRKKGRKEGKRKHWLYKKNVARNSLRND